MNLIESSFDVTTAKRTSAHPVFSVFYPDYVVFIIYDVTRGGDSNIHCTCGRDRDQNAIKSAFWYRSNDREGFLDNQTSIFPCILVHCTGFLCTSVNLWKLIILIPVAAASTVHIGVAAPCVLCTFTLSGM